MSAARRAWDLPLAAHAALLTAILVGFVAVTGTRAVFFSDEGAGLLQAELVAGGDWTLPNPLPSVDPDGDSFPLVVSDRTDDGYAPLGKHPAYPLLLAPATDAAGQAGAVGLSVVGTVVAALAAGGLGARLRPGAARPAFWIAGLGSPLAIDGLLVAAHTVGAALAGCAVLAAVAAHERRSAGRLALAAVLLVALGVLRTEGVLLGLAVGAAFVLTAVVRRDRWCVLAGAVTGAAAIAALVADRILATAVLGDVIGQGGSTVTQPWRGLEGRLLATWATVLRPSDDHIDSGAMLAFLGAVLTVAAAVVARRRPGDREGITLFAFLAAAAYVIRAIVGPPLPMSGLLVVFPAGLAGLVLVRRDEVREVSGTVLAAAAGLFALAVAATQYPFGGGTEWGGRYFALGLPLAAPLAAAARRGSVCSWRRGRRVATVALVVASLAVTAVGVMSVRNEHRVHEGLAAAVRRARGDTPVVVSADPRVPRFLWRQIDDATWQLSLHDDLRSYTQKLADAGIEEWLLIAPSGDSDIAEVAPAYRAAARIDFEVEHAVRTDEWALVTFRKANT